MRRVQYVTDFYDESNIHEEHYKIVINLFSYDICPVLQIPVLYFYVLHFHVLHFVPSISCPVFHFRHFQSTPAVNVVVFIRQQ